MKKIIAIVSSLGTIVAAPLAVVSCSTPNNVKSADGKTPILITDGGTVGDKSFNMLGLKGVTDWGKEHNGDLSHNYFESPSNDSNGLNQGYKFAKSKKADAMVLNGFSHDTAINDGTALKTAAGTPLIWVDGYEKIDGDNNHTIRFNSELSGFKAGYETIKYLTAFDENGNSTNDQMKNIWKDDSSKLSIGGFMGSSNKYGVDNYFWGMLTGVETYVLEHKDEKWADKIVLANDNNRQFSKGLEGLVAPDGSDSSWYTGGFTIPLPGLDTAISLLNQQNINVIFPIAGPQVSAVFSDSKMEARKTLVIGVDTDQVLLYSDKKDRFLTSAVKKIDVAVKDELDVTLKYNTKEEKNITVTKEGLDTNSKWSSITYGNGNILQKETLELTDELSKAILDKYEAAGEKPTDYFKASVISSSAQWIIDNVLDKK